MRQDVNPRRRQFCAASVAALAGLASGPAIGSAQARCARIEPVPQSRPLFILIDRTTSLPDEVHDRFVAACLAAMSDGGRVIVARFGGTSAMLTETLFDETYGRPQTPADKERQRFDRSPAAIKSDAACREAQQKHIESALRQGLAADLGREGISPVIDACCEMLAARRPNEPAPGLVLVSDAIEYRPPTSFYKAGTDTLAVPTPGPFIDGLRKHGVLPDARQAEVWHVGFGLTAPVAGRPRMLRARAEDAALAALWSALWQAAGARRWAFGRPLLPNGFD